MAKSQHEPELTAGGIGRPDSETPITGLPISKPWWSRERFPGAALFNFGTFLLPAVYGTLSKLWVAKIDSNLVATTDVYTYIGVFAEVLNEGLPRVSYLIIGDRSSRTKHSRIQLSNTLIVFQTLLGLTMSIVFATSATRFAQTFVPEPIREASLKYIRITAFLALTSAVEVSVASATRALDRPDVPLAINTVKVAVNIVLDLAILSPFRPAKINPTVNTQALVRLLCDIVSALAGLAFYLLQMRRFLRAKDEAELSRMASATASAAATGNPSTASKTIAPSVTALLILVRPGIYTFVESAFRNAIYLWLISGVVEMGLTYATAWGVFNTIRWGLVMVPVQAFEASANTFIGHAWGERRKIWGVGENKPVASRADLRKVVRPALLSILAVLAIEIPLFLILTFAAVRPFALYLSGDQVVADVVRHMWRTIDWCYIFYAISTQASTILLATRPELYWWKSFASNFGWDLPWAIAINRIGITESTAWKFHAVVFGGSLVWSSGVTAVFVGWWWWSLRRGKTTLGRWVGT